MLLISVLLMLYYLSLSIVDFDLSLYFLLGTGDVRPEQHLKVINSVANLNMLNYMVVFLEGSDPIKELFPDIGHH